MLALPALSFAQWGQDGGIPGSVRQADGALWEDRLVPYGERPCAEKSEARCIPHFVVVRNDSELPIQCDLTMGTEPAGDIVVTPKAAKSGREVLKPVGAPAPVFSSKCVLLPATLPPRPADACETETTVIYPEGYYPPGARRRAEGGEPVLDVTLSDKNRIVSFRVVRSSGSQDLDTAAIMVIKALRYLPGCGGRTVRRGVLFEVSVPKDDRTPADCHAGCGPLTNDIAVTVTTGQ